MSARFVLNVIQTLLLAYGFAAIGRFVSRSSPSDVFAWSDMFLIGCGVSALLVFPLSLILPQAAVKVIWFLVLLAASIQTVLFLRRGLR
jgi:hypothetical protein